MPGISLPTKILFPQLMPLNHCPHRPVHHHNPLPQRFFQLAPPQDDSFPCFHDNSLEKNYPLSTNISAYHDTSIYLRTLTNLCLGLIQRRDTLFPSWRCRLEA